MKKISNLFQIFKIQRSILQKNKVIVDYEKANVHALKKIYADVKIIYGLFYYTQLIWRKIQILV